MQSPSPPNFSLLHPSSGIEHCIGPYRTVGELGRGGGGVVYSATRIGTTDRVAVKVLSRDNQSPDDRAKFQRECKIHSTLDHKNIVSFLDSSGEGDGEPYLVLEMLHGEPLDAVLRKHPQMPPSEVLRIAREVAEGLDYLHKMFFVHRDIKPANVFLVGSERTAKLLDFGIARSLCGDDAVTARGTWVGTPGYISIQQFHATAIDLRMDLFNLGILLFLMATGEHPYPKSKQLNFNELLKDPSELRYGLKSTLPAEANRLILELLAVEPSDRPESAHAVVEKLKRIEATLPNAGETFVRPTPSRPVTDTVGNFGTTDETHPEIIESEPPGNDNPRPGILQPATPVAKPDPPIEAPTKILPKPITDADSLPTERRLYRLDLVSIVIAIVSILAVTVGVSKLPAVDFDTATIAVAFFVLGLVRVLWLTVKTDRVQSGGETDFTIVAPSVKVLFSLMPPGAVQLGSRVRTDFLSIALGIFASMLLLFGISQLPQFNIVPFSLAVFYSLLLIVKVSWPTDKPIR